MFRTAGGIALNQVKDALCGCGKRSGRMRSRGWASRLVVSAMVMSGFDARVGVGQEPPRFRVRTDAQAVLDADALREELRGISDARGRVNPLADYGPRGAGQTRVSGRGGAIVDDEAHRAPQLDESARKRLERMPPSVSGQDLHVVTLLPPPRWVGSRTSGGVLPAGWVSSGAGTLSLAGGIDDGFRPVGQESGAVRFANYVQQVDPQANVPPSLNVPGLGLPSAGVPSTGLPSLPSTNYPPVVGAPGVALPSGVIPSNVAPPPGVVGSPVPYGAVGSNVGSSVGVPSGVANTIPGGIPMGGVSGVAPATMPSGAVPTAVYPAPPSYVVPTPSGVGGGMVAGGYPTGGVNGYVGSPLPTYSRAGTFVNSAPFVTPAPAAVDARWMVSPAVWQQASRGAVDPNCVPAAGVAGAGAMAVPSGAGLGVNPAMGRNNVVGVVPNPGLVPAPTASPFAYAPPAAMPPATVYAPANGGYVPLVGFGQGANAQLGRGLYGQPTAYVDGQPVRNFLRYVFP